MRGGGKEPLCKFTDRLFYSIWKRRWKREGEVMMRFVGNHFIEISTGMEEGKKRRENCKSRAISRRFFSRTDHAKGKGLLEERGNWKEGELRKFNFHMEIWFCRYTQVVLSKKEEKGTTAIYCPKNSSKLHFHTPALYNSLLGVRTSILYTNVVARQWVSNRSKYFPLREKW